MSSLRDDQPVFEWVDDDEDETSSSPEESSNEDHQSRGVGSPSAEEPRNDDLA
jgi:hypothetical protein